MKKQQGQQGSKGADQNRSKTDQQRGAGTRNTGNRDRDEE
jgi:hypothetical protein